MGLLDDAIREHLELKRRRGADPGLVAREERDALAPMFEEEEAEDQHGDLAHAGDAPEVLDGYAADADPVEGHPVAGTDLDDLSTVGQETAELDMRAVMAEEAPAADAVPSADPAVGGDYAPQAPDEEQPFEWEASGSEPSELLPENIPGQERLSFE
jgi:hypothetical protein